MSSILITGAAGFIGSHLCEHFLNLGWSVTGIDNFCTGTQDNIDLLVEHPQFSFIRHDVCEPWHEIIVNNLNRNFKFVFHLASPAAVNQYQNLTLETMWSNSFGLKNALEFATSKNARLVFSSTSEIYGSPKVSPQSEAYWGHVNSFGTRSAYDESKRFGESLIYNWNLRYKTHHGLVRIFNTYGPRMNPLDGRVIVQFIRQAYQSAPLYIFGTGLQTRSFCYIDDLIRGIVAYANSESTVPINLGNDFEITIHDLAETVIQVLRSRSSLTFLPLPLDDPPQRKPDLTMARQRLNYQPIVSLKEGIQKLYDSEFK